MSLSMDKAIRGATKPKRAAPKKKYLDVLIPATARDDTLETMFMSLDYRMKEPSWTVVFKSLIVIHILMRCGKNDKVLSYLVRFSGLLNVSSFRDKSGFHHGGEQIKNIHTYAIYLEEKVAVYRELKTDFIKVAIEENGERLKKLTVAKGLLREIKILQRQLETLLDCKFYVDEINNDITLLAFNLLVKDLLSLFRVVNEGVINVLDQYFEMSKIDAKEALQIYKKFCKQTERVVDYLGAAKKVPHLGVSIPNLKHAPTSLTVSLEEYVNDPDFEINRQQYKHAKERAKAQKTQGSSTSTPDARQLQLTQTKPVENKPSDSKPKNDSSVASTTPLPTSSDKIQPKENNDFVDFFASLEQEHTVIFNNYQNTGTNTLGASSFRYSTNPFLTMQTQNQGIQSPIQQNSNRQNLQNMFTTTNPFRSSVYVQDPAPISQDVVPYQNPFFQSSSPITNTSNPFNSFSSMNSGATFQPQSPQQTIQPSITPITPVASLTTDSNPFRRLSMSPGFASQQTQLTVFSQSSHSQDSSTSSFQSTSSTLSQNQFSSYSGF